MLSNQYIFCRLLFWAALAFCSAVFSTAAAQPQDTTGRKKVEVMHADFIRSMDYNGKTINRLIGNVQLMHNGAIMSCDSAYQISSSKFEAFGRIVIIKDDARLTGDWLDYDGSINLAQVRGTMVRLYDKTATLRTQYLDFDTKENIGHFFDGGTITNKESLIESNHGYYYSNEKIFRFSEHIEIKDATYEIKSESGEYNTHTDVATFTAHTTIWHKDGLLSCDYGWYDKLRDYFHFSENAYVQTKDQEIWADSIYYNKKIGQGELYGHIQILDTIQQTIGFGNEGHFIEEPKQATLTRMPSVAYYTYEDNQADTLFMRADTLRFVTEKNPLFYKIDSVAADTTVIGSPEIDSAIKDTTANLPERFGQAQQLPIEKDTLQKIGEVPAAIDTTIVDSTDIVLAAKDTLHQSTNVNQPDSLEVAAVPDSLIRKLYAYFNTRAYRQDIQAACDSFYYSSLDSLGHMVGRPILWNKQQQITANEILFYADPDKKKMLRADFLESAFIIAQEQDTFYNQVKGRDIVGHFRNNDLYLIDVLGGAQTVYYLQEDSVVANGNLAESIGMQIEVEKQKIKRIKYINKPIIDIYPIDQLPTEKATLKGFEWREAERPKSRWEICTEIPRASQRAVASKLTKPDFPITKRLDSVKE